ncbi:MAG: FTR1 family protein [Alphaproteobacteria bacterium]|nr:FTR1 family protein [Alphaproteobacteria bacterium]
MLETLLITFREGLEAFLIVVIMLAYIKKAGYTNLIKPVYAGATVALAISATTGLHVAELANDPRWEGTLSLIAGALVASFTIYIIKTAKNIRSDIGARIEKTASANTAMAEIGVFAFTVLMIAREGMETALMLGTISAQEDAVMMWSGALIALALIALVGYLWVTQSTKINLRLFLQVSGIFLVLFSINLFIYGLHELSEMSAIPFIGEDANTAFHIFTEPIESSIGSNMITLGLLGVPIIWLFGAFIRDKFAMRKSAAIAAE